MTANGVEFSLFAPYNESVALTGSWNNWERIPMTKDEQGWWHVSVPLDDGDYEYKFVVKSLSYFMVGEEAHVADPRAVQLSADFENACLKVRNGQRAITTYEWKHDDKPLPPNDALVIYEMHVGDFTGGPGDDQDGPKGRFQDVIDKLDYLAGLGVNAIELMPCNEFPGYRSWGYNPRSIFAVENNYGSPDDLCRLVDECHARGIRVIHDGVYNHSEDNAPLTKIDYTYWYHKENPDEPYNRFGPKFDYQHFDENLQVWPARAHVCEAILFWIEHFHIDGIRFDATYLINHYEFLDWLHEQIFKNVMHKPFYTIAEHIPQNPTIAGPDGPLDAAWHEHFYQQMMSTITGMSRDGREPYNIEGIINVLDPRRDGFKGAFNVVNYIDNHDKERVMWELGQTGKWFDAPAFRRNKLGAALVLTAPGAPMIYMGQEFGESAPKTTDWQKIDWSLLQNHNNADLMRYYAGLIGLRKHTRALQSNTFEPIFADQERCIFAFKRWDEGGGVVVVVANLNDDYEGEIQIGNWPGDGVWHEHVHNYNVQVQGGILKDHLAESEVKIYIKV
jgi:1,4-alpha-glucan branching enzyme